MITLIVLLTVSVTINVLFIIVIVFALLRSRPPARSTTVATVQTVTLPPRTVEIYTLIDPTNGRVKYVGYSDNVRRRINQHLHKAFSSDAMALWIQELYEQGLQPRVKVVASGVSFKDALAVESQFIAEYIRAGEKLFNKEAARPSSELMRRILIEGPDG